ncbi:M23 family metallopeptidase [Nocardia sp. NPDC059180]|uniref:M23 family metallopeptidase n=1 Tax=Nocardia sp. NPDC059180 TaxID=3346761 RepID=UPI0036B81B52
MLEKAPRSTLDQDSVEEPATDGRAADETGLGEQRRTDSADDTPVTITRSRALRFPRLRRNRRAVATTVVEPSEPDLDFPDSEPTAEPDETRSTGSATAAGSEASAPGDDADSESAAGGNEASALAAAESRAPGDGEADIPASERLKDVPMVGGVVLAPDWRTRGEGKRPGLRAFIGPHVERVRELTRKRPSRDDIQELLAKRPTGDEVRATLRKHRVLIGGVTVVALFAAADSTFLGMVTDSGPAPGQVQRIAVAYPWQMQTTTPSVRRYLDAVDHGERLREQAVVAAAARATLERARNEAAAAASGERQPWMGAPPPPAVSMIPGTVLPGGIAPGAGGFVLPAIGAFTSGFGSRWGTFHNGIDVAGPIGTPIYAVANGTVIDAGPAQGFGLWVRIRHDDGSISVYGHMYDFFVSVGERVPAGMQIARMGNRGDSTGPHLHFEVIVGGQHVDPQRWLALHGLTYS